MVFFVNPKRENYRRINCKEDPGNIDITICSLDKPEDFVPKSDIYADTKLSWVK